MGMIPILQKGAYGGLSDDRFVGIDNSFQEIVNLEIRENPKSIKLQNQAVKDTASTIEDEVICMVTIQSTGTIVAFGDTGKIYTKISGTWAKNTYVVPSSKKVLGAIEYNNKLYFSVDTTLYSIAIANITTNFTGNVDTVGTFGIGNTRQHPMITMSSVMYIGDGNKIASVNISGSFDAAALILAAGEEVIKLTGNSSVIKIYTYKYLTEFGRCYLRQRTATAPDQFGDWDGLSIRQGVSKDGNDYIIAGSQPRMYYTSGIEKQALKKLPSVSTNPYCMTVFKDNVVFGGVGGIYSWGNYTKDYPQSLTLDYKTSNNNTTDIIGTVHNSNGTLYFSWKNGTSYGIDKVDTTKYYASGYLVTRVYYSSMGFLNKNAQERYNTFKKLITNQSIKLYTRTDLDTDRVLQSTIDSSTTTTMFSRTPLNINFNYVEFKVELNGPSTSTPELIESSIRFNENGL